MPAALSARTRTALALVGSFALGGGLLYLALRGVDFGAVREALRTAAYGWLLPLVGVTLLSHALRAWRWKLLLDTLPSEDGAETSVARRVPLRVAFYSVMIGYLVNLAAPRLGEVARAANVAAQTPLRFPAVFGTVVVERMLDVLTLGLALLSVVALFGDRLAGVAEVFAGNARAALRGLPEVPWLIVLAGLFAVLLGGVLLAHRFLRRPETRRPPGGRLAGLMRAFRDGLATLLHVRRKGAVLLSTVGIWACYLLMADLPLRMLGLASAYALSLLDSWALMNVGAVGMSLPSPGGTGSFHYVTVQTLVHLFGVAESPAATYALLTHAAGLVLYCVAGFACLLLQGTSLRALRASAARTPGARTPGAASLS